MDKELLTKFQSVVDSFNRKEFTSHDFIKKFLEKYEDDYRDIFSVKTLQTTHAQLARLLSENAKALGITKSEKTLSENFHGKKSFVQGWKFLIVYLVAFVCTSMEMSAQTFLSIPNPEEDNVVMSQMYKVIRDKEYYPDDLKINAKISATDTFTDVYNPYYRGFNYNDSELLDMVEEEQQQTWKWLYTSNYKIKKDTYP